MRTVMTLVLLASAALALRPQSAPPVPDAAPADNALHSSLLLPKEMSKTVPVVLLLSGSGPTDRDGNSTMLPGKNNSLQMLAPRPARRRTIRPPSWPLSTAPACSPT